MVATKSMLDLNQALALVKEFFDQFQISCNKTNPPTVTEFQKFLSPNFSLMSNERHLAKNLQEYINHMATVQKKYSNFKIVPAKEEPIFAKDKLAIAYELHVTSRQSKQPVVILMIGIAKFEDNKIKNWFEVSHQRGDHQWNA